jgi:hypothetical protein
VERPELISLAMLILNRIVDVFCIGAGNRASLGVYDETPASSNFCLSLALPSHTG